jgi:CRP-like cAMP-binding protein
MGHYMLVDDPIEDICIIEHGIAEVYLHVNGRDMLFERLFRGSVINYKSIF